MSIHKMNRFTPMHRLFAVGSMLVYLLCTSYCVSATANLEHKQQEVKEPWKIVNFWAQWCKPCRQEIPELNRLSVMLSSTNIDVVGINYDDITGAELARALASLDIRFPQLDASQQALINFSMPAALPATYIVSPAGEVKASLIGLQSLESILTALERVNPQFVSSAFITEELVVTP